jgi:tripartite ATP-independent transporter DctM subunit
MTIDIGLGTGILFASLILLMTTGLPILFVLGGIVCVFQIIMFGWDSTYTLFLTAFDNMTASLLLAGLLFFLMAAVLQDSGIADDAYDMALKWCGGINGGLAVGTILVCTVFAAITGLSGAATISMGLIAIPSMIKRGYSKHLAIGTVAVGGVLGIVIPPSVIMIIYALVAKVSAAKMFMGGVIPGLVCAFIYCIYILIRCWLRPTDGPALPVESRATWLEKVKSLTAFLPPMFLMFMVLGTIWLGVATPTESAAFGAAGAFICAAINKKLSWKLVKNSCKAVVKIQAMVLWLFSAATAFSNLYTQMGAREGLANLLAGAQLSPWTILIMMQLSLLVLGCLIDDYAVIMLCVPLYCPIITQLGFDPLWFGILFILNMQVAYLTPPYGFNLFYLKSVVPKGITMGDIYKGVVPFIGLQILGLIIIMIFPPLATWLPNMMFTPK